MIHTYKNIFERDLQVLHSEVSSFIDENDLWKKLDGTSNSAGNLCLHLIGNLKHFIGVGLGERRYNRNREAEFTNGPVSKAELLSQIEDCRLITQEVFKDLNDSILSKDFPFPWRAGEFFDTHFMLTQLVLHFNYHMGQINYHRRYFNSMS